MSESTPPQPAPEPPSDAETTVSRRTWTEPNPDGGEPILHEEIVTTTTWETETVTETVYGGDAHLDAHLDAVVAKAEHAARQQATIHSTAPGPQRDAPRVVQEPAADREKPVALPGVPTDDRRSWWQRLLGR